MSNPSNVLLRAESTANMAVTHATNAKLPLPAEAILRGLGQPVMVIDMLLHLLYANESAERLLAQKDILIRRDGRLVPCIDQAEVIQKAIAAAPTRRRARLRLSDAGGFQRGFVIQPLDAADARPARPRFALIGQGGQPTQERLIDLYGLTRVEADLTMHIHGGADVGEAAERLKISRHTARKYLQAVFSKVAVNRQVDLVRRICEDCLLDEG